MTYPTDEEIEEWADACPEAPLEEMDPEVHGWRRCFTAKEFSETIRAAIARWGHPTPQPVAERPSDEELDSVMFQAVWECMDKASDLTDDEMDRLKARAVLANWRAPITNLSPATPAIIDASNCAGSRCVQPSIADALRALAVRINGADALRQDVLDIADELEALDA